MMVTRWRWRQRLAYMINAPWPNVNFARTHVFFCVVQVCVKQLNHGGNITHRVCVSGLSQSCVIRTHTHNFIMWTPAKTQSVKYTKIFLGANEMQRRPIPPVDKINDYNNNRVRTHARAPQMKWVFFRVDIVFQSATMACYNNNTCLAICHLIVQQKSR